MVLPASDAGEAADPLSASILRGADPETHPGNVCHRMGNSWKMAVHVSSLDFACLQLRFPQLFILSCQLCSLGNVAVTGQQRGRQKQPCPLCPPHGPPASASPGALPCASAVEGHGLGPLVLLVSWPPFPLPSGFP